MSTITFPQLDGEMQIEQLVDRLELFRKDFDFLMSGNLSSQNAREFGGFQITLDTIRAKTKDVGMSSSRASSENVRFWAGDTNMEEAPYRVYDTGRLVASDADITGKVTALSGAIGGWVISENEITDETGMVGMSSAVSAGDNVRFFAGSINPASAPFRVYESGTIYAQKDVYIGNKLYMNPTSFTSDILFTSNIKAYADPAAGSLRLVAPGGIYANGIRIDVEPDPPPAV